MSKHIGQRRPGRLVATAAILLSFGPLAGCERPEVRTAEQAVKEKLNDPDSAIFSDVKVTALGNVCGRVNWKNRLGGYDGPHRFYVELDSSGQAAPGAAAIEDSGSPYWQTFIQGWQLNCPNDQ